MRLADAALVHEACMLPMQLLHREQALQHGVVAELLNVGALKVDDPEQVLILIPMLDCEMPSDLSSPGRSGRGARCDAPSGNSGVQQTHSVD